IKGIFWKRRSEDPKRRVIVISTFEHHAILDPVHWLAEAEGAEVIEVPVTREGFINFEFLKSAIENRSDEIALVSIIHANNEVGTIQPISEVVKLAERYSIPVHTDAIQSFGKIPLNFSELGLFAMTISAHKIGGPVGVGALILKRGVDVTPLLHGGGQERDIRSGTVNAAAIVAFASAAQVAIRNREKNSLYVASLRDSLKETIKADVPDAIFNASELRSIALALVAVALLKIRTTPVEPQIESVSHSISGICLMSFMRMSLRTFSLSMQAVELQIHACAVMRR
ncbi:MAG: aminotransferase class V-fold PLP-dependent enzyme, partial [Actinobacteria bacterium]|nr:aminotransferase class V-fold PLP-dependent enzyme [Actinomycetota bacterium]